MKNKELAVSKDIAPIQILLADEDDRELFQIALKSLPIPTQLSTITSCDKLMLYLSDNEKDLPDLLFLDFKMPRLNGAECVSEIQKNQRLKNLPLIIYSQFISENVEKFLYDKGVRFYVRKADLLELKKSLHHILNLLIKNDLAQPLREKFMLTLPST